MIIAIAGKSHDFKQYEDQTRDGLLKNLGFTVIRFTEFELHDDIENVGRTSENFLPDSMKD